MVIHRYYHAPGATFSIYLPLVVEPFSINQVVSEEQPHALDGNETVLVVEDESFVPALIVRPGLAKVTLRRTGKKGRGVVVGEAVARRRSSVTL